MPQTYTIWFNRSFLKIVNPSSVNAETELLYTTIIKNQAQLDALLFPDSQLFDGKSNDPILVAFDEVGKVLEKIKSSLTLIYAGGGIVFNELNQILLIKRKGMWDLPKGKVEEGEKIRVTAIREVEEETAVKIETAEEQSFVTFHCYTMDNKQYLKETHWFEMDAALNQELLIPQREEGIEKVLWVNTADLPLYQDEAFPMVWSILEVYLKGR